MEKSIQEGIPLVIPYFGTDSTSVVKYGADKEEWQSMVPDSSLMESCISKKIKDTLVGSAWIGIRQLKVTWVCSRVEPQVLSLQLSRTSTRKTQTNPNKGTEYLLAILQKGNLFEIPRQENGGMKT